MDKTNVILELLPVTPANYFCVKYIVDGQCHQSGKGYLQ